MGNRVTTSNSKVGLASPADSRRQKIIKAAFSLFLKKGIFKTTVREIARKSGITVGTLYHYITSKDDIVSLILEEEVNTINDFIRETDEALSQSGPIEALRLAIEKYLHLVDDIQDYVLFTYQETKNLQPAQRGKILHYEDLFAEIFNKIVVAGCKSGVFKQHDTLLTAHTLIVLGDMWAFRRWFLRKHCTLKDYHRKQTDLILSGICNSARPD